MCVCLEGGWGGSGSHSIVYNFGIGLNDVRYLVTSLDTRPCLKDIYKWPSACSCLLLMWCSDFKICHIYYFHGFLLRFSYLDFKLSLVQLPEHNVQKYFSPVMSIELICIVRTNQKIVYTGWTLITTVNYFICEFCPASNWLIIILLHKTNTVGS